MHKAILEASERIKNLQVQGARNVAIAAIKAVEEAAKDSKAKQKEAFLKELTEAKSILFSSRETEPLMRNAIRHIIQTIISSDKESVNELTNDVSEISKMVLERFETTMETITEVGSKRIINGSRILTHCHSSTVTAVLKRAKINGKKFEVVCTESRPVYQGRITAKEMLDAGVRTTLIVDSAARHFMNEIDLVMVGADAITSEGNVINKIGTSMVALVAKEARTPFYVVSELLKFDPITICGDYERIEEREPEEIWVNSPPGLIIRNPAFEVTRREFIHGIICEEGIVSPHSINELMNRKYQWIYKT